MSESKYEIKTNPKYETEIRALQNEDPVNAEQIINPLIETLVNNTHAVKLSVDAMEKEHVQDKDIHVSLVEKEQYLDKYTKTEIDNRFAEFEYGLDWKESVDTFSDIAKYYPNPEDGWTVNTKDNNYTYRYDDETDSWIEISANAIPLATSEVDGKMSKEQVQKLEGIDTAANKYIHPNSGAAAGTYRSVTVNEQGHVTNGTNPTITVAQGGTGATDAAAARTNLGVPPTSHASTGTGYGVSSAENYGHAMASSTVPKAAGTAAAGSEDTKFARGDHVHPVQTTVSGNAGTATKLAAARKIALSGDAGGSGNFDGSADLNISTTLSASGVTAGDYGPDTNTSPANSTSFIVPQVTVDTKGRVTAAANRTITLPAAYSHPNSGATAGTYRSVTVNAQGHVTAGTNPTVTVAQGGTGAVDAAGARSNLGAAPTSHASAETTYGVSSATDYGHAMASSTTPKVAGTASAGTEAAKFARGDHVHPVQTSVSGNAGTATKLAAARKIAVTGDSTGSGNFDGSADLSISTTLASSGVTAGSYGPSAAASPANGASFNVPQVTVDAKGRVTSAANRAITLPAAYNHPESGVTAGTYRSVTVNEQGHVTAGSNPTITVGQGGTGAADAAGARTNLGVPPTSHASTGTGYGVSSAANYGHAMASSTTPKAAGTAAAGSEDAKFARGDHVHPLQTTVSGNAGTATKLATARKITLTGDAAGSGNFDGSADISFATTLASSGVTAGSYGPTAATAPGNGGAFNVPQVTVDAKGRVISATNRAITLPAVYTHPNSGATAGTYRSVTVNAQGHVTAGTNPTVTVAQGGTGATDAAGARTNLGVPPTSHASTGTSYGVSSSSNYGHAMATSTAPKAAGTAAVGSETGKFARGDHVHPLQTTVSGNAGTSTKLATARKINGISFDGSTDISVSTTIPVNITSQTVNVNNYNYTNGIAQGKWMSTSDGGASNITNLPVSGKAFLLLLETIRQVSATDYIQYQKCIVGSSKEEYLRWCVNGTWTGWVKTATAGVAQSASQLATSRNIALTGDVTGTTAFNGTANASITATLANSGVTAGSYGPSAAASPGYGGSFNVPQITVDAKGRAQTVTNRAITLPAAYSHPNSGATAGTYRSVTVNAQGHVTAGTNPTVTVAQGGTGATTAAAARANLAAQKKVQYGTSLPTSGMEEGDVFILYN